MAIIIEAKSMHEPAHPGAVLRELYLEPLKITQEAAADALGVSRKHMSAIVNGRSPVTPDMALRLATALDTDPDIWINLQAQFDIWTLKQKPKPNVKSLRAA